MQEIRVQSLGQEKPLEGKWQPTPVFLHGKLHGQRSLAGYSPSDCKESDMTEQLSTDTGKAGKGYDQSAQCWESPDLISV